MEGTKAIKDFLALPMSIHMAVDKANEDGTINFADLGLLVDPGMKGGPFLSSLSCIPKEISDLNDEELVDVQEWAKDEYNLTNDQVEGIVESAFGLALHLAQFLGKLLPTLPNSEEDDSN